MSDFKYLIRKGLILKFQHYQEITGGGEDWQSLLSLWVFLCCIYMTEAAFSAKSVDAKAGRHVIAG